MLWIIKIQSQSVNRYLCGLKAFSHLAETPLRAQQRDVIVKERRPYPFTVVFLEFLHGYPREYVVRSWYISRRALAGIRGTLKDVDQEHGPCGSREFNLVRNLVSSVSCGWNRSWTIVRKHETVFEHHSQSLWMYHIYMICGHLINFHKRSDEEITISEDDCEIGISYLGKIDRD